MLKAPPEDVTRELKELHIVESADEEAKGSNSQAQVGGLEPVRDVAEATTSSTGFQDLCVNPLDPSDNAPSATSAIAATTENCRIFSLEADLAESPPAVESIQAPGQRRWKVATIILLSVLLLASVIVNIVLAVNQSSDSGSKGSVASTPNEPSTSPVDTTNAIRVRGYLTCGVIENPGFSMMDSSTGTWSGFEVDLCRAVGAAIFQEDGHVRFAATTVQDRFVLLQSGQVDLLAAGVTYTMERDLYEPTAKAGFTFSVPYLYNGLSFAGVPKYVACAEQGLLTGNCSGIRICVQDGSSHVPVLKKLFPNLSVIYLAPTTPDFYNNFVKGLCNVLAVEQFDLAQRNVIQAGYSGAYSLSQTLFSKEPIALVTRDDDAEWSDFVNWVFIALLAAENRTITQKTAKTVIDQPAADVDLSPMMFYHAVATVGNYAETYTRHLQKIVPRAPVNQQNTGDTPLVYSFPFGDEAAIGPGPTTDGTLEKIRSRGVLRCGIGSDPLFSKFNFTSQQWSGLDVYVCMAISAAIFNGSGSTQFIQIDPDKRFTELANRNIDVLVRSTGVNYERDVSETSTKVGFTFSPPNYITGLRFGGIPQYSDCANSVDVSSPNCKGLLICVNNATTNMRNTYRLFGKEFVKLQRTEAAVYECLSQKISNVIGGFGIFGATVKEYYKGTYKEGTKLFSRDNLSPVTNQDDPQWSSFVSWIMYALYFAEENNITQATHDKMPVVNLFGLSFAFMFQRAIQAVGSYSEVYSRSAGLDYPNLTRVNTPNNSSVLGPLHFPPPGLFGLY